MKSNNTSYQYIRTIRFRSNSPAQQSKCFEEKKNAVNFKDEKFNLNEFYKELNKIKENLEDIFYHTHSEKNQKEKNRENLPNSITKLTQDNLEFQKGISVKLNWLRRYHKHDFYLLIKNNKIKRWSLSKDLESIHSKFKEKFNSLKETVKKIETTSKASKEVQERHADIFHTIKQLKVQLPYFINFLNSAHTSKPYLDKKIDETIKLYEIFQKPLKQAEKNYLSNEDSGIEITKTSFNYYTVNKKPKVYEKEIEETNKKLYCNPYTSLSKNKKGHIEWNKKNNNRKYNHNKNNQNIFKFKSDLEKKWIEEWAKKELQKNLSNLNHSETPCTYLTLDKTYKCMKAFKAEQKSIFYEIMNHIVEKKKNEYKVNNKNHLLYGSEISFEELDTVNEFNKLFSLFNFIDKDKHLNNSKTEKWNKEKWFDYFIQLTKNNPQENIESRKSKKEKRGKLFLFGGNSYFTEYYYFCKKYKKIAQEKGNLKSQLKGLEAEKLESSQTHYWSFIYIENNHKQLWLVPKDKIQLAKEFIDSKNKDSINENDCYLCCFESLTMRALNKLCFSEQSTFVKDEHMPSELKDLQKNAKIFKTEGDGEKIKEKNEKKLQFYKKLLKSDYFDRNKDPKDKGLDVKNFNLDWIDSVKSPEEFETKLEQSCYFLKTIKLSKDEKNKFIQDYQVTTLDITSYDIEGKNKKYNPISSNRLHTNLWNSFWKDAFFSDKPELTEQDKEKNLHNSIRLNPEVKVYYRKSNDKLKKYFNKKNFPETFKHRKKQSQITLAFTLTLNAGGKYESLAFSKPEDIGKAIDDFNKNLNNERLNFKTAWKYGIDRGKNELATLCIAKMSGKIPEFKKFECLTLKDYNYLGAYLTKTGEKKEGKAILNISNFIDNENLFQKNQTSCLDLTAAKVIKGKIVSNGDVMTYLKFKKESAKRTLYEFYSKRKIQGKTLKWSKYIDGDTRQLNLEGVLNIQLNDNKEQTIYHYCKKYEDILSQKEIQNSLNAYLKDLLDSNHSKHTPSIEKINHLKEAVKGSSKTKAEAVPSIEKINHLKEAITANVVGVICRLQEQYPGFIILEDIEKESINKLSNQNSENIYRKLEYALYNKYQSKGLVPPHVKNIIELREDLRKKQNKQNKQNKNQIKSSQIGTIVFVDESNTSSICPACENNITICSIHISSKKENGCSLCTNLNKKNKRLKFEQQRFKCSYCDFDTYLFKSKEDKTPNYEPKEDINNKEKFQYLEDLDDPDKVAAYNIAVKITDPDEIGKWKTIKEEIKKDNHNKKKNHNRSHAYNLRRNKNFYKTK